MSQFVELFDEFASYSYNIWVLKKGYESHDCILIYDTNTKQAYLQFNLWEKDFKMMELRSIHQTQLFEELMEFLKSKTFLRYKKDSEKLLKKTDDILLAEFLNKHVQKSYLGRELEVFVMQLDVPFQEF